MKQEKEKSKVVGFRALHNGEFINVFLNKKIAIGTPGKMTFVTMESDAVDFAFTVLMTEFGQQYVALIFSGFEKSILFIIDLVKRGCLQSKLIHDNVRVITVLPQDALLLTFPLQKSIILSYQDHKLREREELLLSRDLQYCLALNEKEVFFNHISDSTICLAKFSFFQWEIQKKLNLYSEIDVLVWQDIIRIIPVKDDCFACLTSYDLPDFFSRIQFHLHIFSKDLCLLHRVDLEKIWPNDLFVLEERYLAVTNAYLDRDIGSEVDEEIIYIQLFDLNKNCKKIKEVYLEKRNALYLSITPDSTLISCNKEGELKRRHLLPESELLRTTTEAILLKKSLPIPALVQIITDYAGFFRVKTRRASNEIEEIRYLDEESIFSKAKKF